MAKFIVLYHMPASEAAWEEVNEADAKKEMDMWMKWSEKCGPALVDFGSPLGGGQRLTKGGSVPSEKEVTGYSVLEAENMEAAKELLSGHPHLQYGEKCSIEVHESMPMSM